MKRIEPNSIMQRVMEPSGVQINGSRPWDIRIHHPDFHERVLSGGSLALGESYMDGCWDCDALDQFFDKILEARLDQAVKIKSFISLFFLVKKRIINDQKKSKAYVIGKRHYDTGNDLFSIMLDKWLNYSCGFWENAKTLDDAQEVKLDLICKKIGLSKGMKILDIGCGWGGFTKYSATKYGAKVHGITVSKEQLHFAKKFCEGLDVEIDLKDYRDLKEKYDNRFYRMWTYYLLSCAGSFRARRNQLWQILFSKKGIKGDIFSRYS